MVCVKDRTCLRMAIPTYYLSIFGSILGDLYFLLIKKVNIRMWHYLAKYEKVSMSSLKCDFHFLIWTKNIISFLKTVHWYGLVFLYLFIRPEDLNLKISENLTTLTLLGEKVSTSAESKWYIWYMYTLWLCITLGYMPKSLVT